MKPSVVCEKLSTIATIQQLIARGEYPRLT